MKTQINKKGWIVTADQRSKRSSAGRPPKMTESAKRHIAKMYKQRQFTSSDFIKSFRLQLVGGKTPVNVKAGMLLNKLCKQGVIEFKGLRDTQKRGNNEKIYKLSIDN